MRVSLTYFFMENLQAPTIPISYLPPIFPDSRFNTPRVKNKICDKFIKTALKTHEKPLRWNYYQKAENCLLETNFIIPLATLNSGYALVRKPWKITRKNQYLLNPYDVTYWKKEMK